MTARRTGVGVAFALAATGCGHSYIYAGRSPPRLEGQDLVVVEAADDADGDRYPVTRIVVQPTDGPTRAPTQEELDAWQQGEPTPDIDILRVDVSTTHAIWGEWALAGFGVGVSTGMLLFGATGIIGPSTSSNHLDLPLALALALVLGVEGGLVGALVGVVVEQGSTDTRLQSYKSGHDIPSFSPSSPP